MDNSHSYHIDRNNNPADIERGHKYHDCDIRVDHHYPYIDMTNFRDVSKVHNKEIVSTTRCNSTIPI